MASPRVNDLPEGADDLILVLFTHSYPYQTMVEGTFLNTEIHFLASNFDRVIVVPQDYGGRMRAVPAGVEVEESYALANQQRYQKMVILSRALSSTLLAKELLARPAIAFRLAALKRLVGFTGRAELARKWVGDFLRSRNLDAGQCIFYAYWLDENALGIGLAKEHYPQIKLVSRAHGYDLYEERHKPAYIPCRRQSLSFLDRLFPDSDNGRTYIANRYPEFAPLCETARLGVGHPGFATSCSQDGVFRIVSCSRMVPVKRVDLLMRGMDCAARLRPEQQFEWHHFGDGPLKDSTEDIAHRTLPDNVNACFPGYPSIEQLMSFYRSSPVDLFMNASESEGIPVSIMEAISCGIPVVATAVGGNPEIVSEQNGKLLSSNPTVREIAAAILGVLENPQLARGKRLGSQLVWRHRFDADRNYQAFADRLKSIRQRT